jgi:hypothetical protein
MTVFPMKEELIFSAVADNRNPSNEGLIQKA